MCTRFAGQPIMRSRNAFDIAAYLYLFALEVLLFNLTTFVGPTERHDGGRCKRQRQIVIIQPQCSTAVSADPWMHLRMRPSPLSLFLNHHCSSLAPFFFLSALFLFLISDFHLVLCDSCTSTLNGDEV